MANTVTLILSENEEKTLYKAWRDYASEAPAYAKWQLRPENCVITCYKSGKTLFQGKDAELYAAPFSQGTPAPAPEACLNSVPQAGSDEVGTGDYFGPVCVCAALITNDNIDLIRKLGVRDSKKLSDMEIREIVPAFIGQVAHSLLILPPEKYNEVHETNNMVSLKCLLHNQAFVHLSRKAVLPGLIVIDQFVSEKSYYRYLSGQPEVIRNIHFETKAEDKYPAVGAASLIARYAFLKSMDQMGEKYNTEFPKGAGDNVDRFTAEFIAEYGFDVLRKTAKLHFKNTEKAAALR